MTLSDPSLARNLPDYLQGAKKVGFNPYSDNGGSVVAIAGDDFCVIGADTRLSSGFQINTRNQEKLFQLSNKTILGCAGCWCDTLSLTRVLAARMQMYKHEHQKEISTPAAAQMLSIILYYKRFFPYYINNVLAGLDEEGKGCVFNYDPIGHVYRVEFSASGSAGLLLQPLLDNQIGYENQENVEKVPITLEKALKVLKDVFTSAAERDIYTGDSILIKIITKDGVKTETFGLRKD
ncbi:proteasome subunit beta type-1 [Leptopilina boulardi]|uniref:proteasome subunit beta type-1 n=1 Tax=Leptopilina boulardi TaxID=63433 RepID=UPI0021F5B04F|nr:proteasome subunit beta type-1 [Leptopilina boulardi]